jgi:hypothetical protein
MAYNPALPSDQTHLRAKSEAPVDELPETAEERRLVEDARAEYARTGESHSQEEVEGMVAAWKQRELAK